MIISVFSNVKNQPPQRFKRDLKKLGSTEGTQIVDSNSRKLENYVNVTHRLSRKMCDNDKSL